MLLVSGIVIGAIAGGTASTYLYDRQAPSLVRVAAGTCSGLAALALIAFVVASLFGVTPAAVGLAAGCASAPALLLALHDYRVQFTRDVADAAVACRRVIRQARLSTLAGSTAILVGSIALWRLMEGAMIVRADGIYTLHQHNLGDLPFHLAAITRFAANHPLPPEHPSFAGLPFTYPFLSDLLSAMLVTAGATLRSALVLPGVLGVFAFVILMHRWTLELTENRGAAWLAPLLVLVGGGLGWWLFARDAIRHAGDLWAFLARLPHDYTIRDEGWRWGNVVTTLLVPQRGLQLALPLAVVVFRQWWLASIDERASRLWAAGIVAGLLPLMHGHTYLVVLASAACLTPLASTPRAWARFFVPAIVLGAPQLLWLSSGRTIDASSFIGWALGWDRGGRNALLFWILNTGSFIPLIVCAVVWRHGGRRLASPHLLRFYLPFALCFLIANVVRLAPWVWDNVKVLVYWWVGSAPLVAMLLIHWLGQRRVWRALALVALISMTLAGALDLWRALSGAATTSVLDERAVAFAALVSDATEAGSTIVHAPTYNHPIVLTGRRSLMGYPGHLWTHGIDYTSREEEIRRMYAGDRDAEALFDRHAIDYVVVGPDERRFGFVDEGFFSQYEVAAASGGYRLYRVRASHE